MPREKSSINRRGNPPGITLTAHAKINWALSVLGRRPDGYHLLDTLMQSVELGDTVRIEPADELSLRVSGNEAVPPGEDNLAYRAALLLQEAAGVQPGASIQLTKRTPVAAGLGGGSADAAAVLFGLDALWGLALPQAQLLGLAARLGADVPFCLAGGLCRARGIGEILEPIGSKRQFDLLIIKPCEGLSTAAVFRQYAALAPPPAQPDIDAAAYALERGDPHALAAAMGNALEAASMPMRPEIAICIRAMEHSGALRAQMTGSGSAVIGLFDSPDALSAAFDACSKTWPQAYKTRTAPRGISVISDIV